MTPQVGINLIGYVSGNLGLGVVAREFARALIYNGYTVAIFDLNAGQGRSGYEMSLQQHFVTSMDDLPHGINVWVIGADRIIDTALDVCNQPSLQAQFNAAFVWWELPDIAPPWAASAQAFDAMITGSEFVREAWSNHISLTPVLLAQCPLHLPPSVAANRPRYGLPEDALLFYTGFEPASDPARKNPFASVHAFKQAFPSDRGVRLVIKINNAGADEGSLTLMTALHQLVGDDDRVIFLTERLAYADLLSLYASCDVVLSLHRAEGLGLVPLEAMRLGKPVIATGWSGNMTYMNHGNAGLVMSEIIATDESSFLYAPSKVGVKSRWAEPSVAHAAAWMRAFADDPIMRKTYGEQAAIGSVRYNEVALRTQFAQELMALHGQRGLRPARDYASIAERIRVAKRRQRHQHLSLPLRLMADARSWLREQYDRRIGWRLQAAADRA